MMRLLFILFLFGLIIWGILRLIRGVLLTLFPFMKPQRTKQSEKPENITSQKLLQCPRCHAFIPASAIHSHKNCHV